MSTEVLGEQVTLPDSILTPGDSWAQIVNLNNHIEGLKADINRRDNVDILRSTPEGTQFGAQWITFVNEWTAWYLQIPHGGSGTVGGVVRSISGSEVAQLRVFAGRYNTFEERAVSLGIVPTLVGNPEGGTPFEVPTVVWVSLGVVALGLTAWLVYSASKFAPAINVAAEPFRRGPSFPPTRSSFPGFVPGYSGLGLRGKGARRRH